MAILPKPQPDENGLTTITGAPASGIIGNATKPAQADVSTFTAPKLGDPSRWTTDPKQTVAGQITSLTNPNSPLIAQARSRAQQDANSRGLLNSSMAGTAGEAAAYDVAMPIARDDAAQASKVAGYNAEAANQFKMQDSKIAADVGLANMGARNQTSQYNTGQTNQFLGQQMQQGFDLTKMEVGASNALKQMSVQQQNDIAQLALKQGFNLETITAQQINELARMTAGQGFDLAKMDKQTALAIGQMSVQQQNDMAQLAAKQGFNLQTIDATQAADLAKLAVQIEAQDRQAETKFGYDKQLVELQKASNREIAGIEAQYRSLTQASASASSIVNNLSTNVARIMENTALDAPAKQKAIDLYNSNAAKALQLIGAMAGDVDLSAFLSDALGVPDTPAATTPTAAVPPPVAAVPPGGGATGGGQFGESGGNN